MTNDFLSHPEIIPEMTSWYPAFKEYLNKNFLPPDQAIPDGPNFNMSQEFFQEKLTQFIVSPGGARFRNQFNFDGDLSCGVAAPKVMVSKPTTTIF